jgi:uncharacterized protein YkwD
MNNKQSSYTFLKQFSVRSLIVVCMFVLVALILFPRDISVTDRYQEGTWQEYPLTGTLPEEPVIPEPLSPNEVLQSLEYSQVILGSSTASLSGYTPSTQQSQEFDRIKQINQELVLLLNQERRTRGLSPLVQDPKLELAARMKINTMIQEGHFDHIGRDGRGVADFLNEAQFDHLRAGENLAFGPFESAQEIHNAWMQSPTHRENILYEQYTHIGIGTSALMVPSNDASENKSASILMSVQHFATNSKFCPIVDTQALVTKNNLEEAARIRLDSILQLEEQIKNQRVGGGIQVIEEYNENVSSYNQLIMRIEELINRYNRSVETYNACIRSLQ